MKKFLKVLLIIFVILALTVAGVAAWQWKNIKSIMLGVNKNTEEISQMRVENQQQLVSELNGFMDEPMREMTEEEKKQVEDGSATVSEIYQKIFEEKSAELEEQYIAENLYTPDADDKKAKDETMLPKADNQNTGSNSTTSSAQTANSEKKPGSQKNDSNSSAVSDKASADKTTGSGENRAGNKDAIISSAMAKLYGLQNKYTAIAESTIAQGAQYYESIKKYDSDPNAKAATISRYTSVVRGVESQCDGEVEAVLATLKADLEAIGADTSVVNSIRQTYASEKQLKLSYYSSMYLN